MAILKSSDGNWYQFRLILGGPLYIIDIDQSSSSAPSPAWPEYWVLKNSSNGLNYKVYLNTSGGETTLNVDQTNVAEPGNPYEILFCADDSTNHKITVVNDEGSYVLEINLDPTSLNSISGVSRIAGTNKSSQTGTARININRTSSITGTAKITLGGKSSQSGTARLIHPYDSILQASNSSWYRFRIMVDESGHVFNIDQIASATSGTQAYWVLTCPDTGLNYKLYLDIDGNNQIFFNVDQTSIAEPGELYKLVYCATDLNYKKVSLVSDEGNIIIQINSDATAITSISGTASILGATTNRARQTGIARIQASSSSRITGVSRITKTQTSNISGTARIGSGTAYSIQGLARIQATLRSSTSGISRINVNSKASISGTASIIVVTTTVGYISGVSRISGTNKATIAGVSRIAIINTASQSGTAKITAYTGSATISGTAKIRVRNRYKYQVTMKHEFAGGSTTL